MKNTEYSMDAIFNLLCDIGRKHGVDKIVLYGSRARGDNRPRSDIDIAIFGVKNEDAFWLDIDNVPTLLEFDVVFVSNDTSAELLENILEDGITIYERSIKE